MATNIIYQIYYKCSVNIYQSIGPFIKNKDRDTPVVE